MRAGIGGAGRACLELPFAEVGVTLPKDGICSVIRVRPTS